MVVNDGSRDRTFQIMCECAKNRPQFIPLTKENGGHGTTVLWAYKYALREGADYIFLRPIQTDRQYRKNLGRSGKNRKTRI